MTISIYQSNPNEKRFITLTFLFSTLFNLLPWGRIAVIPDLISLIFLLWSIREPRKISIKHTFIIGTLIDVHKHSLFGEHILNYILIIYFTSCAQRRLVQIPSIFQVIFIFPILITSTLVPSLISSLINGEKTSLINLLPVSISSLVWPLFVLLIDYTTKCNDK